MPFHMSTFMQEKCPRSWGLLEYFPHTYIYDYSKDSFAHINMVCNFQNDQDTEMNHPFLAHAKTPPQHEW